MKTHPVSWLGILLLAPLLGAAEPSGSLSLHARARKSTSTTAVDGSQVVESLLQWDPRKTAIIVCDMWDQHWCRGATARVAEMAPRMNEVLKAARHKGVLIIHAPSDTMTFYANSPQRRRAQAAPSATLPAGVNQWRSLNQAKEGPLPIDDSDGGCDDTPPCSQGHPWQQQSSALELQPEDALSDRGDEVFNLLRERGIENVILMGVHTNMCVLGRPFAIRQMVSLGLKVLLMRDLTDTMYNSRRRPYVSHFVGTDLVIEHIEKHWCATVTSADFLGGEPFRFQADRRPKVVFVIGEPEYNTKITLPEFAEKILAGRGLRPTFIHASETDTNDFRGLEAVQDADLLCLSLRRRTPPKAQVEAIRRHLDAGKPLVGLRTASHGLDAQPPDKDHAAWKTFDVEVLGAKYQGHHNNPPRVGPPTVVTVAPEAGRHPILTALPTNGFRVKSHLYKSRDLGPMVTPLLMGAVEGSTNQEPIAWVNTANHRRVFYTSMGSQEDFAEPAFRRLLLNGILWALDWPIPPAD